MRKCTKCNEKCVTWMVVYNLDFGGNNIMNLFNFDKNTFNPKVIARICINCM